jgi:hypothetical protein
LPLTGRDAEPPTVCEQGALLSASGPVAVIHTGSFREIHSQRKRAAGLNLRATLSCHLVALRLPNHPRAHRAALFKYFV